MRAKVLVAGGLVGLGALAAGLLLGRSPERAGPAPPAQAVTLLDPQHPYAAICMTVATSILGRKVDLAASRRAIPSDGLGRSSMADLLDGLRSNGFGAVGCKLEPSALRRLAGAPLILYVDRSHFLVVLPVGDGSVVLFDPPRAPEKVSPAEFRQRWTGEAIIVQRTQPELASLLHSLRLAGRVDAHAR